MIATIIKLIITFLSAVRDKFKMEGVEEERFRQRLSERIDEIHEKAEPPKTSSKDKLIALENRRKELAAARKKRFGL